MGGDPLKIGDMWGYIGLGMLSTYVRDGVGLGVDQSACVCEL